MKNLTSIRPNTSRPARLAALKQSFQDWNNTSDVMARLARRLSTTLSLEAQLSILAEEMTDLVPFDSLTYRHRFVRLDFVFSSGMCRPQRCE